MFYDGRFRDAHVVGPSIGGGGVFAIPRQVQMVHQHYPQQQQQQQQQLPFAVQNFIYRDLAALSGVGATKETSGYRGPRSQLHGGRPGATIDGTFVGQGVAAGRRDSGVGHSCCCVPTGCTRYAEDPIDPTDPGDAVRVLCSNPGCTVGRWMHADCFDEWDRRATYHMR